MIAVHETFRKAVFASRIENSQNLNKEWFSSRPNLPAPENAQEKPENAQEKRVCCTFDRILITGDGSVGSQFASKKVKTSVRVLDVKLFYTRSAPRKP